MNLTNYQNAAFRTCPDLGAKYYTLLEPDDARILAKKLNLNHMVSGMNSELSELNDASDEVNEAEELADIMWYVGGYCTFKGYDLEHISTLQFPLNNSLAWYIQELTDLVKKFTAYNKPIDPLTETGYLNSIINWIKNRLGEDRFNKALQNNIDKLRVRYPEKFSDENAVNRNLEAERKELEK